MYVECDHDFTDQDYYVGCGIADLCVLCDCNSNLDGAVMVYKLAYAALNHSILQCRPIWIFDMILKFCGNKNLFLVNNENDHISLLFSLLQ